MTPEYIMRLIKAQLTGGTISHYHDAARQEEVYRWYPDGDSDNGVYMAVSTDWIASQRRGQGRVVASMIVTKLAEQYEKALAEDMGF